MISPLRNPKHMTSEKAKDRKKNRELPPPKKKIQEISFLGEIGEGSLDHPPKCSTRLDGWLDPSII